MQATRRFGDGSGLPQWRVKVMLWLVAAAALVLIGKLFYLQVMESEFLGGKATAAHLTERSIAPPRGKITDRNGAMLAANRNADRLYADPQYLRKLGLDPRAVAQELAPIFKLPEAEIETKLLAETQWVSLATRLTPEQSEAVRALKIPGIGLEPTPARVYPNGSLSSHVLGFTNFEGVGTYGVEGVYNKYLTGKAGKVLAERDSNGNWIAIGHQQVVAPQSGADVELTIDSTIQYYIEEELKEVVKEQDAKGGTIIVMQPHTGEILAMASAPDFKPGEFDQVKGTQRFLNPAISSQYEPGSTFKIITMAAGLAEGVITPDTRFNDPGYLNVYGYTVINWDARAHPNESMTEVLMNSANVGAAYVSTKVGADAYYRRLKQFGFGSATGVDLQGEATGMLTLPSSPNWSPINLYTNAYGQGIGVTPLQLITAEAAVANGGLLMRPYVVSKVSRDGEVVKENEPTAIRRVLEPEVAETLKGMMETTVEKGEYQVARIPGYSIGGKTGTASIATKNGYDQTGTIASFVGYSPVEDPKFIVLIKIDEPKKSPWGSDVAAPAFKNIARRVYAYLNMPPDNPSAIGNKQP